MLGEILDQEDYQHRRGQFLAGLAPLPLEDSKLPPSKITSPGILLSEQEKERCQVLAGLVHPYAPTHDDDGEGETLND